MMSRLWGRIAVLALMSTLCPLLSAEQRSVPEITGQGFDIRNPLTGIVGEFGRVRLRFEAYERIAKLRIVERSFEADLASTLETSNLELFGLSSRVRKHRDVTLNLQKYLNEKLITKGRYQFLMHLEDGDGQSVRAELVVIAEEKPSVQTEPRAESKAVTRAGFDFQRIGPGAVTTAPDFDITWRTVDRDNVRIRISAKDGVPVRLFALKPHVYEQLETVEQLRGRLSQAAVAETIEMATVSDEAAGEVFGIESSGSFYVLKVKRSRTSISKLGTTVVLSGEFKR